MIIIIKIQMPNHEGTKQLPQHRRHPIVRQADC